MIHLAFPCCIQILAPLCASLWVWPSSPGLSFHVHIFGFRGPCLLCFRKIRAPIKIKSALPPPKNPKYPPPPKTRNFMDMVFPAERTLFFPGVHKIGAAISDPRIADTNFTDMGIFLICCLAEPIHTQLWVAMAWKIIWKQHERS